MPIHLPSLGDGEQPCTVPRRKDSNLLVERLEAQHEPTRPLPLYPAYDNRIRKLRGSGRNSGRRESHVSRPPFLDDMTASFGSVAKLTTNLPSLE